MSFAIDSRKSGDVMTFDLSGRLVHGEDAASLREKIKSAVAGGEKKILLNMKDVSYIDSSGLGTLVGSLGTVQGGEGQMKLVNLSTMVHDVIRITKLHMVFEVFDNEEDAVRSFA